MIHPLKMTTSILSASLLLGCGGGGSTNADGSPDSGGNSSSNGGTIEAPPALLAASSAAVVLAASGSARALKLSNLGTVTAEALELRVTGLPSGTTAHSGCPTELPPDASCLVLIRPGTRPSAEPEALAPVPAKLTFRGSNTHVIDVDVSVITYGSFHQGGLVFALDDRTAITSSVSGKVVASADSTPSVHWSPSATEVAGVSDNAVAGASSCNGAVDGQCNTARILAQFSSGGRNFAAAQCADSREGGFADWYLPALCEMGYSAEGVGSGICGTETVPLVPDNVRSRLYDANMKRFFPSRYWTSTQSSANPGTDAHQVAFAASIPTSETAKVLETLPSKCARAFAP